MVVVKTLNRIVVVLVVLVVLVVVVVKTIELVKPIELAMVEEAKYNCGGGGK